jgi:hypothetical protein
MIFMQKLTDENPYDILGIPFNADKKIITKAFAKKNRGNIQDRRLARQSYDTLRKSEERLQIDALLPVFSANDQDDQIVQEFEAPISKAVNWLEFLDEEQIQKQDLLALTEATIKCLFKEIQPPKDDLQLQSDFDGLRKFLDEWLK